MDHAVLVQGFSSALVLAMGLVIASDVVRYTIPNWLNGAIIGLYLAGLFFLPADPLWALLAAALVLVVGLGIFALGLMGGGDVKLLVALTLWTGGGMPTVQFLFLTAVAGGLLVVVILLLRVTLGPVLTGMRPGRVLPRLLTRKEPVPYGLAIAVAFLWLMARGGVPMLA